MNSRAWMGYRKPRDGDVEDGGEAHGDRDDLGYADVDDEGQIVGDDEGAGPDETGDPLDDGEDEGDEGEDGGEGADDGGEGDDAEALENDKIAKIAEAVARGMSSSRGGDERQTETKLSPDEIKKLLNTYEVSEEVLRELGFNEPSAPQIKAFQNFVNGIVKNATSVTNVIFQNELQKLRGELTPIRAHVEETRMSQARNMFFSRNKHLKKYEPIVKSVALGFNAKRADGSEMTVDEVSKGIARETERLLGEAGIKVSRKGDGANHGADHGAGGVPRMASLAGSGRSSTRGNTGKKSDDADMYSDWK